MLILFIWNNKTHPHSGIELAGWKSSNLLMAQVVKSWKIYKFVNISQVSFFVLTTSCLAWWYYAGVHHTESFQPWQPWSSWCLSAQFDITTYNNSEEDQSSIRKFHIDNFSHCHCSKSRCWHFCSSVRLTCCGINVARPSQSQYT